MATIHKRTLVSGEVVWELTHGTGGDRVRIVAGKTQEEAQEVLTQFKRQLALHGKAPGDGSIGAVLGEYTQFLTANRRGGTQRRYLRVLRTFISCFLHRYHPDVRRVRQVTPVHIEAYKTKRLEGTLVEETDRDSQRRDANLRAQKGKQSPTRRDNAKFGWLGRKPFRPAVTPRTVNYELQVLRTFFRWAVRRNHLFINPTVTVERLRVPKRSMPKFLTAEQLKRLFGACSGRERRLFMTILLTGMRKGEVEHLVWSDINFDLGIVFIQEKPESGWKPKTDERIIPMSPTLRDILLQHFAERRNDGLVFPNRAGGLDIHILPKLKKLGRRVGLPGITVHALRHSFGAHLRMAGVNLSDIADLLGHKDLATTQIYAKVQQDHLRSVISRLAPIVVDSTTPSKALPESSSQPTPPTDASKLDD